MDPAPPTALSKETIRVWHGWCNVGDKEVAREAAAKGSHVSLAITFLSLRKKIEYDDAEIWFKEEVMKWVGELLDRRQIFRASHVLKNIGVDAENKFSNIFYTTRESGLREYIGSHLQKTGKLNDNLQHLWTFLSIIFENSVIVSRYKTTVESLECLDKLSDSLKSEIATTLFLTTEDNHLCKFINGETLWQYLLKNSDVDNILLWINVRYQSSIDDIKEGNMVKLFKKFAITTDMVNLITSTDLNMSMNTKNVICNELSRFGIFINEEKDNFLLILQRLRDSLSLGKLYEILSNEHSIVKVENFICLLTDYCLKYRYFNVINNCIEFFEIPEIITNSYINLIDDFRQLVSDFNEEQLSKNIVDVANALCVNVEKYFHENPLIFLTLLFFIHDVNISDVILFGENLVINGVKLNKCILSLLNNLPILNQMFVNKFNVTPPRYLKMYDLIDSDDKLRSRFLFEFRFLNVDLYNFYTTSVVQAHGYCKRLNYTFYLKQARPSVATKFLISSDTINSDQRKMIEKKINKLAVTCMNNQDICASCIFCLECLGFDSFKLRTLIKTVEVSHKSPTIEEFLPDILMSNEDEPYTLQNVLEKILMEIIESKLPSGGSQLVESFQIYQILIQYSKITNIKLPELLLKYCASQNLWLPFLLLAQIYNYPLEQLKLLIQFFKSPNMLEHLTHGVVNDVQLEEKNVLIRERDSRKYLLSKVGVRQSLETINQYSSQSIKSESSYDSEGSSTGSDKFEIDISNIKATLLQTLIRCHNSTDPPKALLQACQLYRIPLLSVFATSYEPDSVVTNWLTWLSVSCDCCKVFTNFETTAVSANAVSNLLENCIKDGYPRTVLESFEIFLPENPLKIFLDFLNHVHQLNFNNTFLILKLNDFESLLKNSRKNSIIAENDHEMTYLNNKVWIELAALKLLAALLEYNCSSLYEQILIIDNLCKIKIWKYFSCECPDFEKILNVLKILYDSNSGVKLDITLMFDIRNSRQAIISCINELLDNQHYEIALKITQIENLPPDLILVKEWQSKMSDRNDQNFWNTCNDSFIKNNVTADCVIDFYLDCSEKLNDLLEKFTLSKLTWEWASKYELSCQYELEKKMWVSFFYLDEKLKDLNSLNLKVTSFRLYKDLTEKLENITIYEGDLSKDFITQIERIILFALDKEDFWLALKIEKMFNCKSSDLEILKLSYSLAEGLLSPQQLNTQQRLLLSNSNNPKTYGHRRTFLSAKFSSLSSSSYSGTTPVQIPPIIDVVDNYVNDTLSILKLFLEHLHSGLSIGQKIFMNYRISINIEIPYQIVVASNDSMKMLKDALEDDCMNKIDVVHDFILAFKWAKHEVADFICEELINATNSYMYSNVDHISLWDINIDQDFQIILQLLQDNCSSLGYKIYSYASTLHKSIIESEQTLKVTELTLVIELLIKAHSCFTADCNMEGISVILKKSKEVVANLLVLQDWKLMVRLLTGVGRYTEMNYVFQILKENDQFEFLLRKGLRKDNTLKVALLEYLKKHCPDSRDLYKIVALHFALFSEVAVLWEREAQNIIKNLISVSILEMQNNKMDPEEELFVLLQNTDSTRNCLNKAMENYIHATDFHLQGEKLTKATDAARQAELIALQLAFLNDANSKSSIICLLGLKSSQIFSLITSSLTFEQSLILTEPYNFHVDWASVLYEQFVTKNNTTYLESFLQHKALTDTLVHDISRKFIASNINSVAEIKCMKHILSRLTSPHTKYKIASELGFTDLVEDQLASASLVYLKDTVWKKGFKS